MKEKLIKGLLIGLYGIGSLLFFTALAGNFMAMMIDQTSGLLLFILASIGLAVYVYSLPKIKELLGQNEPLKGYLIGNATVWALTFVLYAGCMSTFTLPH